ncbi:hypothetical protein LP421_08710 [Rhizobium sp. RCAM05350]|nr:hypothetical protein LP421_08710 [Rhizobium sp. RCAM05350]
MNKAAGAGHVEKGIDLAGQQFRQRGVGIERHAFACLHLQNIEDQRGCEESATVLDADGDLLTGQTFHVLDISACKNMDFLVVEWEHDAHAAHRLLHLRIICLECFQIFEHIALHDAELGVFAVADADEILKRSCGFLDVECQSTSLAERRDIPPDLNVGALRPSGHDVLFEFGCGYRSQRKRREDRGNPKSLSEHHVFST